MDKLHAFSPREIQRMLCGEQAPRWTKDDLMNYTEPKFGYSRESPGFLRLVNVLLNFSGEERKVGFIRLEYSVYSKVLSF